MKIEIADVFIDPGYLDHLAEQHREGYAAAAPFPHVVLDDFLPPAMLDRVLDEFPAPDAIKWQSFSNKSERKLASSLEQSMGMATRLLLYQLNSATFVSFLEKLTGIQGIIPDPHFVGGGLHQIRTGGYLKIHADFNKHEGFHLDRRLNLLIYLNKDWPETYGGHLELWDAEMKACVKRVLPVFNRCVIFSTTDFSYHGHPNPLNCPEDRTRKSLALYYYSNGRPAEEIHAEGAHWTLFRERPDEDLQEMVSLPEKLKHQARRWLPPALIDGLRKLRR